MPLGLQSIGINHFRHSGECRNPGFRSKTGSRVKPGMTTGEKIGDCCTSQGRLARSRDCPEPPPSPEGFVQQVRIGALRWSRQVASDIAARLVAEEFVELVAAHLRDGGRQVRCVDFAADRRLAPPDVVRFDIFGRCTHVARIQRRFNAPGAGLLDFDQRDVIIVIDIDFGKEFYGIGEGGSSFRPRQPAIAILVCGAEAFFAGPMARFTDAIDGV
jgi:hypothetical protein